MNRFLFMFFVLCTMSLSAAVERIEKVVIWGHKLHSHTHSYIHHAFYRAFQHKQYPTYWFDKNDDVSQFDFSNCLFITEGQVDTNIPVRGDCIYVLHNCYDTKYQALRDSGKAISLQVYTDDVLKYQTEEISKCIHYDVPGKIVYMPWATDLLPHEINEIKAKMPVKKSSHKVYWIGTVGGGYFGNENEINPFRKACREKGVEFVHYGSNISPENHRHLISTSYMAPTIVGAWQAKVNYIPCRIFKNISYGQMGITNSYRVYELFEKKIVYNSNTHQLFYDARKALQTMKLKELFELMDFVRDHHTYLNRIQTLFTFIDLVAEKYGE